MSNNSERMAEFAKHLNVSGYQAMSNSALFKALRDAIKKHDDYKHCATVNEAMDKWKPVAKPVVEAKATEVVKPADVKPSESAKERYVERRGEPIAIKVDVAAPVIHVPATEVLSAYRIAEWAQTFVFGIAIGVLFSRMALKALGIGG